MSITEETVRQIEDPVVQKLAEVSIDDVYEYEDRMRGDRKAPLDLYDLWEGLNWKVADLDFSEDKVHWENLFPFVKEELFLTFTLFFIGEQEVTDTLSPLLHAAPTEDDRIFLSTQVVDEARHTVFFKKFFEQVLGVGGGLAGAFARLRPGAVEGFKQIFDNELRGAVDRVRLDPADRAAWVRGIATYHLVIEGMLALTGQKFLLRTFRNLGIMPGFRAGFTAVARDESRHVNYGVGAIKDQIRRDPRLAGEVIDQVEVLIEPAVMTVEPGDIEHGDGIEHPNELPLQLRINPREVYEFSLDSLAKRLRVAGIPPEDTSRIKDRGWEVYWRQIEKWEENLGREHSIRFWDRGEVLIA